MNAHLLLVINGWAGYNGVLDAAMIFLAQYLVYFVFAAALAWFLAALYRRDFRHATFFIINLVIAFILLEVAKHAYIEQRPFVTWHLTRLIAHPANQSFPSDHTTAASAIAFGFLFLTKWKKTGVLLLVAALVIGFARIFVGVHYPGDIGGAVITALVAALIAYAIYWPTWRKREPNETKQDEPAVQRRDE